MSRTESTVTDLTSREGRDVIELVGETDESSGELTIFDPDDDAITTAWITSDVFIDLEGYHE